MALLGQGPAEFAFTWSLHGAIWLIDADFSFELGSPATSLYTLGLAGPLLAALVLSARSRGRAGVRQLLGLALRWRFGVAVYLCALLSVPVLRLVNAAAASSDAPEGLVWIRLEWIGILGQAWVVVAEEYGWRGYLLPRLRARFGWLGAALVLGVVWASWHLPMFFIPGSPQYAESFAAAFPAYVVVVTSWSIVMAVLYSRSGGSLLPCMLFHASLNVAGFSIQIPPGSDFSAYLLAGLALAAIPFFPRPFFGPGR